MTQDTTTRVQQGPANQPPFRDTPVLSAQRRAFDSPTQANLDALVEAVQAQERAQRDALTAALRDVVEEMRSDQFRTMDMSGKSASIRWADKLAVLLKEIGTAPQPKEAHALD